MFRLYKAVGSIFLVLYTLIIKHMSSSISAVYCKQNLKLYLPSPGENKMAATHLTVSTTPIFVLPINILYILQQFCLFHFYVYFYLTFDLKINLSLRWHKIQIQNQHQLTGIVNKVTCVILPKKQRK